MTNGKNIFKLFAPFLLVMLLLTEGIAQRAIDDLERLNRLLGQRKFNMDMEYRFYTSYTSATPVEVKQYYISFWDVKMHMRTENTEIIRADNYQLSVNRKQKMIVYQRSGLGKLKKELDRMADLISMDSVMKKYTRTELIHQSKSLRTHRLYYPASPNGKYAYVDLTFNLQSGLLQKVIMYFAMSVSEMRARGKKIPAPQSKDFPRMEIVYKDFTIPAKESSAGFSFDKYLARDKSGNVKPHDAYKDFEFVDYTKKDQK